MSAGDSVAPGRPDYELLEPIHPIYGLATIFTSVLLFQAINQVVYRCAAPPPGATDLLKWRNLVISWIHALIVGTWDLSCFYFYPELVTDLIAFHNIYIYTMVAFSTGYFVHDFIDIAVNKRLTAMWEVIPHHFAVAGMFFYNVMVSRCIAYNVIALLAEVNTVFLHARKLLQLHGVSYEHPLYRANATANLATFVLCRFSGVVWIIGGMFVWADRVSATYFYVLGASMFVMSVTNVLLFWRLLVSDVIRPWSKGRGQGRSRGRGQQAKDSPLAGVINGKLSDELNAVADAPAQDFGVDKILGATQEDHSLAANGGGVNGRKPGGGGSRGNANNNREEAVLNGSVAEVADAAVRRRV